MGEAIQPGRLIEAGHYYAAHGPTIWAVRGWRHLEVMSQSDDRSMLFVDNLHGIEDVPEEEKGLDILTFSPRADYRALELSGEINDAAEEVFHLLQTPGEQKRVKIRRRRSDQAWMLNGQIGMVLKWPDGQPTCVLLDAGLSLYKRRLGFTRGVNILPAHYAGEQDKLLRLVELVIPDFQLDVMLFDMERIWLHATVNPQRELACI
jgi:hypothetical protein